MLIAALFTITWTWKQPGSPLTDGWIKMLWYIYTMKYFSAIKKNKFELVGVRWMSLVIQSLLYRVKLVRKRKTNIIY